MQKEDNKAVHSPLIEKHLNRICLSLFSHPFSFLLSCSLPNVCLQFRDRLLKKTYLVCMYAQLHTFCPSIKSTYINPKPAPLASEKRTLLSGFFSQDLWTRCSRQKERHEEKKALCKYLICSFGHAANTPALPGSLFSLLQEHDVRCLKEWQTHWSIGYNCNHKSGYLLRHY